MEKALEVDRLKLADEQRRSYNFQIIVKKRVIFVEPLLGTCEVTDWRRKNLLWRRSGSEFTTHQAPQEQILVGDHI